VREFELVGASRRRLVIEQWRGDGQLVRRQFERRHRVWLRQRGGLELGKWRDVEFEQWYDVELEQWRDVQL
jgi:hypothetical protein